MGLHAKDCSIVTWRLWAQIATATQQRRGEALYMTLPKPSHNAKSSCTAALIFWKKREDFVKTEKSLLHSSIVGVIYQWKFPSLHIHQCTYNLMNTKLSFPFNADDEEKKRSKTIVFFLVFWYIPVLSKAKDVKPIKCQRR